MILPQSAVSPVWLNENLENPNLVILDVSQPDNKAKQESIYGNSIIPNARFFDLKNTFRDQESPYPAMLPKPERFEVECRKLGINKDSHIIVYDNLGIYFSPRVWWMFKAMGHANIAVLDGGLPAWIHAGFKESIQVNTEPAQGDFESQYDDHWICTMRDVENNLNTQKSMLVDARSSGRFQGTEAEPRKGLQSGHIPYSINLPYGNVLNNERYKTKDQLKDVFNGLKFDERPLIFSCGSGVTACIILLAAELVMPNAKKVYDGSWSEWALMNDKLIDTGTV